MMKNRLLILFLPLLLSVVPAAAKGLSAEKRKEISQMLTRILDREVAGCKTNVTQVVDAGNRLTLYASIGMSYYPFRERSVAAIYDSIRSLLPASLARRRLSLVTDKHPIEELIPQIYRSGSRGKTFTNRSDRPLVTRLSSPVKPTHGLAAEISSTDASPFARNSTIRAASVESDASACSSKNCSAAFSSRKVFLSREKPGRKSNSSRI